MKVGLFASGPVGLAVSKLFMSHPDIEIAYWATPTTETSRFCAELELENVHPVDGSLTQLQLDLLMSERLDLILLAWWPYIVPASVIDAPRLGVLNLHPSLLPHNRGKDPNFWAIIEERPFGVTIHWVDEGVDTGDIAFQRELVVSWEDTGRSLYEAANAAIIELVQDSLPSIVRGEIPRIPQGTHGSAHRRSELDQASWIDLDQPTTARAVLNLIRARTFEPHPGARFAENGGIYEVRVTIDRVGDLGGGEQRSG